MSAAAPAPIAVLSACRARAIEAAQLASELRLPLAEDARDHPFLLALTPEHLELRQCGPGAPGPVYVDFVHGALGYRRRHGGAGSEPLARAVGSRPGYRPSVLDATAGLGRDAFVLAGLGCRVHLLERSPIVAALLRDGLKRALADPAIGPIVSERMTLTVADTLDYLTHLPEAQRPEVIYLDPMYPERGKSALVKKEMRLFRALVGEDLDAPALLQAALRCARRRVVVKRPRPAEPIVGPPRSFMIDGRSTRFDVYLIPED